MPNTNMFEPISTFTIKLDLKEFIACEQFVVDTGHGTPVKISCLGDNFMKWFIDKIEQPPAQANIRCYAFNTLIDAFMDEPIITEFGGEQEVVITLTEIFALMKSQGNGQQGKLLNGGVEGENIFCVYDIDGVLRIINVTWYGGGWALGANPVGHGYKLKIGNQVFCRNSSLKN